VTNLTTRVAFSNWPMFNGRLRDRVASLTDEQVVLQSAPDRWPVWAIVGHLACQRVFGLCDVGGEPGAETTPFPNAAYNCPGDDDLENVLTAGQLVAALDSTFAIVERVLDTWALDSLDEIISHPEWDDPRTQPRGELVARTFAHDVWHIADLNDTLARHDLPLVDIWS
jgi:hypothetical protein